MRGTGHICQDPVRRWTRVAGEKMQNPRWWPGFWLEPLKDGKAKAETGRGKGRLGLAGVLWNTESLRGLRDVSVRCPVCWRTGERSLGWRQGFGTGEP